MKNNYNDMNDEKFIRNCKKRKSDIKTKKTSSYNTRTVSRTKSKNSTSAKHSSTRNYEPKFKHATLFIVFGVLCSIFLTFTCMLLFSPSFRTVAIRHVLDSASANRGLKNVSDIENSMSDGISHTIISGDGEKGSLHSEVYTFLATGTDHGGNLTDVIMIAKFDTEKKKVDILQIPRDTYVKLSDRLIIDKNGNISAENFTSGYETKANSIYSAGKKLSKTPINNLISQAKGKSSSKIAALCSSNEYSYLGITQQQLIKYLNETDSSQKKELMSNMQRNFGIKYLSTFIYYSYGIPIDYHAQVNTRGFRNIVDAIGGVDLYVPQNMYHNDPTQDLYINLKAGQQHLDGDKAEQFVRFRGYTMGDIARIDAQKSFINAFLDKLFSASTITRLSQITSEVQKNLYTNITLQEMADFASKLLDMDLSNGFSMTTLPGNPVDVTRGGVWVSYYSADKEDVMELVNKSFNKYNKNLPEEMFGLLTLSGTSVSKVSTVTGTEDATEIPDASSSKNTESDLSDTQKVNDNEQDDENEPENELNASSDVPTDNDDCEIGSDEITQNVTSDNSSDTNNESQDDEPVNTDSGIITSTNEDVFYESEDSDTAITDTSVVTEQSTMPE
ncbi:MAG: LCP family protein [Clostridia bacterium]|nr:LCP family protein [Clostridia bacterium]